MRKFGQFNSYGVLIILVLLLSLVITGFIFDPHVQNTTSRAIVPPPIDNSSSTTRTHSLQLSTPLFISNELPTGQPTPTPKIGACDYHGIKHPTCECPGIETVAVECIDRTLCPDKPFSGLETEEEMRRCGIGYYNADPSTQITRPNCSFVCVGKPVIYLYPKTQTTVSVKLDIPGVIVESDPFYPEEGWNDIEAFPDGSLFYKNNWYKELYYESQIDKIVPPKNGIFIPIATLQETLTQATTALGLRGDEQKEFLDYWLPKLYSLDKPYILFGILDRQEKERIDHVAISPKPDTMIEFLAYFKGINQPYPIIPLLLPATPPKRNGFTAVEWGGTIDFERMGRDF